jgi:hypothetical protein
MNTAEIYDAMMELDRAAAGNDMEQYAAALATFHAAKEKEAVEKLVYLQTNEDKESVHTKADEILCNLLRDTGYGEAVKAFEKIEKWYA